MTKKHMLKEYKIENYKEKIYAETLTQVLRIFYFGF